MPWKANLLLYITQLRSLDTVIYIFEISHKFPGTHAILGFPLQIRIFYMMNSFHCFVFENYVHTCISVVYEKYFGMVHEKMPRKCCTHFDGKPCTSNYNSNPEKVPVFRFPKDPDERSIWINSLPSKVKVNDDTVVCEKHWLPDFPRKNCQGPLGYRPSKAPSEFGTTPLSFLPQTQSTVERNVEDRNVSAESRAKRTKLDLEQRDFIGCWDDLRTYCETVDLVSDLGTDFIKLYHIEGMPPTIIYSIFISRDMKVTAYKGSSSINLRDVIASLDWKIRRFSEVDSIIDKVRKFPMNIQTEIKQTADNLISQCGDNDALDIPIKKRINFLCDQLTLCCASGDKGRRYSVEIMQIAIELMLRSRNCYKALLNILALPSIQTVKSYFGKLGSPESLGECKEVISNVFSKLDGFQKYCSITADEIHVKPSLQFQKDKVIGFAADVDTPCVAKTVLAVMINPSMGASAFVARLLPVFSLKQEFLTDQINIVMKIIHEVGGYVFLIMTDNLSVNQKMFKVYHKENQSTAIYSIRHPINNPIFDTLFTLYDMPHCFKSIRNNWVTEPSQTLQFVEPITQIVYKAKWKDLVKIYNDECKSILKETKLSYAALYPTNFEKQKVQLACDIFNEKTVAALEIRNMTGTAIFVKLVTRMWNIINVKSPHAGYRTNDPDRQPFCDDSDKRFEYLSKVATMFKTMDNSPKGRRLHSLTDDTSNALHQTLSGLVALIKYKLGVGFKYVLPGKYQSDRLEAEFGIYRQSAGGNYCISTFQVYNGLKLQRIKLYHKLEMSEKMHTNVDDECCENLTENNEALDIIDSCFLISLQLTNLEKSSLYFISGYVAFMEGYAVDIPEIQGDDSEFLENVSRGKLSHPPSELYDLSQYLFSFFKTREKKCCSKLYLDAYQTIYDTTGVEFENISSILRRFNNCFFKAFAKDINDQEKRSKDDKKVKQRRLSSRR